MLRPLLSVRRLEAYATPAPIEFGKLLHLIDSNPQLVADIHELLERKRGAPEMGLAPQVATIHAFIEAELLRLEPIDIQQEVHTTFDGTSHLNELFVRCLQD